MLAIAYLLAGAALVVVAVYGMLGLWWAALAAGLFLLVLGVLEARAPLPAAPPDSEPVSVATGDL